MISLWVLQVRCLSSSTTTAVTRGMWLAGCQADGCSSGVLSRMDWFEYLHFDLTLYLDIYRIVIYRCTSLVGGTVWRRWVHLSAGMRATMSGRWCLPWWHPDMDLVRSLTNTPVIAMILQIKRVLHHFDAYHADNYDITCLCRRSIRGRSPVRVRGSRRLGVSELCGEVGSGHTDLELCGWDEQGTQHGWGGRHWHKVGHIRI